MKFWAVDKLFNLGGHLCILLDNGEMKASSERNIMVNVAEWTNYGIVFLFGCMFGWLHNKCT